MACIMAGRGMLLGDWSREYLTHDVFFLVCLLLGMEGLSSGDVEGREERRGRSGWFVSQRFGCTRLLRSSRGHRGKVCLESRKGRKEEDEDEDGDKRRKMMQTREEKRKKTD